MSEFVYKRVDRVGQLIQQELGDLLVNGVRDPRVGFVTVTEVRLTPDLRHARVFVSVYGDDDKRQETLQGLEGAAGFLKRELGRRIRLRFTPALSFAHDDSLDRAERLDELLDAAASGATQAPKEQAKELAPTETVRTDLAHKAASLAAASPESPQPRRRHDKGSRRGRRRRKSE